MSERFTISKRLSKDLNIFCLSKDDLKIELYEKFGFCSYEEKKQLDMLADEHIYDIILKYISTSQDLIVDKWYIDTDKIFDKLKNNYPNIICVQLCVSAKVATKRYNERLINNLKPLSLNVLNKYPIVQDITMYENIKTIEEMEVRIKNTPKIKNCNAYLNLVNDKEKLDDIYHLALSFISENMR